MLPGLPHEYDGKKVVVLPPLAEPAPAAGTASGAARALVIGQPLVGAGLMSVSDRDAIADEIAQWLARHDVHAIDYKAHPKDPRRELLQPGYRLVEPGEALETYMSTHLSVRRRCAPPRFDVRAPDLLPRRRWLPLAGSAWFKSSDEEAPRRASRCAA